MIHALVHIVTVAGLELLATVDAGEFQTLNMSLHVVAQVLIFIRLLSTNRTGQPSILIFCYHGAHRLINEVFVELI